MKQNISLETAFKIKGSIKKWIITISISFGIALLFLIIGSAVAGHGYSYNYSWRYSQQANSEIIIGLVVTILALTSWFLCYFISSLIFLSKIFALSDEYKNNTLFALFIVGMFSFMALIVAIIALNKICNKVIVSE